MSSARPRQRALQPNAVVAVDVVLFTVRPGVLVEDAWQVLLARRDEPVYEDKWSLPGVLVHPDETFDGAARRALQTKVGLDARNWYLDQLGTFGAPHRDTRGRVVSVAHMALVQSDDLLPIPGGGVKRIEWLPVRRVAGEALAFDHADMLRVAINRVQSKLRYSWVAFQLLPETFTLPELRAVYAAILDPALTRMNTSNFKKGFGALFSTGALVSVGRRADRHGRVGRPGDLYRFQGPVGGTWERELPWDRGNGRPATTSAGRFA